MKHWPIIASLIAIGVIANFLLPQFFTPPPSLAILSGSENRTLAPIIKSWSDENNVKVTLDYAGSVDISRELSKGADSRYDAVWPAHSLWIDLGDEQHVVIHRRSILTSPVVLALKRSIAQELDWEGRNDLTIEDIAAAAQAKSFRLAMTSATQSNSGASAYLGFLHALSGKPEPLTLAALDDPDLQEQIRGLLAQIDRSSGSSGWLKDMLVANPDRFDAMVNYEAMALEANQALIAAEQEPLYLIYPVNGIAVADSPLGLIDKGDPKTEEAFLALQAHLLSGKIQQSLIAQGRRAGLVDVTNSELIRRSLPIWNSAFGTDLSREITPVPTPEAEVIQKALTLYQTDLRKPSLTVWVLDVSGSMEGKPLNQLKTAMRMLFDPNQVAELL
ncbi:MAG: substrate-binding domain-containing protein, partial [Mangrovicoccus sp.]